MIPATTAPKADGQSRYGWLAASLRARITQGEWPPGAALPAEAALAREHGVALGTIRQAIALLVADDLLERRHGRGTFVRAGLGGASMLRFFRFRQGEYRVIYSVDDTNHIVLVIKVGHRREVYRSAP